MQVVQIKSAFLRNEVTLVKSFSRKLKDINYDIDRLDGLSTGFHNSKINKKEFSKKVKEIIRFLTEAIKYARIAISKKSKSAHTKSVMYAGKAAVLAKDLKISIKNIISGKSKFALGFNSNKAYNIGRKLNKLWVDIQRLLNVVVETSETIINKTKTEFNDSTRYIADNVKKSYNLFDNELKKNYISLLKLLAENKIIYDKLGEVREVSQEPGEIKDIDSLMKKFKPLTKHNNLIDLISKKFKLINNSILNSQGYIGRKGLSAIESPGEMYSSSVFLNGKIKKLIKNFKNWAKKSKLILQRKHKLPIKKETEDGEIFISEVKKDSKLFGVMEKKHVLAIGLTVAAILVLPRLLGALTARAQRKIKDNR